MEQTSKEGSADSSTPVLIDGSFGEGGGQIIRNAVSLACILKKIINIIKIRANRPNPGLASQHLESILALNKISGARTSVQLRKGLTEFELDGTSVIERSSAINETIDLVTAGSVSLCVQVLLPYLLTLTRPSQLRIIGGTHTMKAPNFDYLDRVFIPTMTKLIGYDFGMRLLRPGYFPRGGGSIQLNVNQPLSALAFKHFNFVQRGRLLRQSAILNITPKLQSYHQSFISSINSIPAQAIETRTVSYASIEYFLEFEHSFVGFYYLVEGRNPASHQLTAGIAQVEQQYQQFLGSEAVVDEFMQDQLIIYMALAKLSTSGQSSSMLTLELGDHTTSAIHVVEKMTGLRFQIEPKQQQQSDKAKTFLISI